MISTSKRHEELVKIHIKPSLNSSKTFLLNISFRKHYFQMVLQERRLDNLKVCNGRLVSSEDVGVISQLCLKMVPDQAGIGSTSRMVIG